MKRLGFSIIAAGLLTGNALATDLLVTPVDMGDPVAVGNFYASVFGGAAMINDFEFESSLNGGIPGVMTFEPGYSVDAALGYDFGNGLSVEGQVGHLSAALAGGNFGGTDTDADGTGSITYGMLNAWYGIDLGGITPFFGGGVGLASVAVDSDFSAFPTSSLDDSETTWAAQLGAGVSLDVTENVAVVGRYRHLMTGEVSLTDDDGHDNTGSASVNIVDVGLKVTF